MRKSGIIPAAILAISSAGLALASEDSYEQHLEQKRVASFKAMDECVSGVVKIFYTQTEPATVVATAALASCTAEVLDVKTAYGFDTLKDAEDATRPHVIAQVMALRAIAAAPTQNSTTPAKKEYLQ